MFASQTKRLMTVLSICLMVFINMSSLAQIAKDSTKPAAHSAEKKWYDNFSIRGYIQARYNRLLETNDQLKCDQCDRSWGENGGISLRRVRLILSGQIHKQVFFYFQTDFGSSPSSTALNYGQIRDAYFDLGVDAKNEFRFRIGQSKIPYGYENMQSSQNRLAFDRSDAINSSLSNERDFGALFYWAPEEKRKLYASLTKDGMKGSGDYGVFALGVFNGQTGNRPEQNNQLHVVSRFNYPFTIGNQIIEPSIQAYTGIYTMPKDLISAGTKTVKDRSYTDQRIAASFVLQPRPFGIQAEYNVGQGPEFNPSTDSIETKSLSGGYVTMSYLIKNKEHLYIPFVRYHQYQGGKKHEIDARSYDVKELEIGLEWQPSKSFELTAMYTISERRFEDFANQNNLQKGNLLRLQAQLNF
jgi:Phosphate-selective porin O and P